jgi:hypothetical protein
LQILAILEGFYCPDTHTFLTFLSTCKSLEVFEYRMRPNTPHLEHFSPTAQVTRILWKSLNVREVFCGDSNVAHIILTGQGIQTRQMEIWEQY